MIRRFAGKAILVAGLALPAPLVCAHGNLFLCARVSVGDDGRISLELTADHGDNPYIADAQEARAVLRDALAVCLGPRRLSLEQLGELRFEDRDRYSDDAPVPPAAEPGPHHLVTALWQARLPGQEVVFAAQDSTPLDVVLWRAGEQPAPGCSRWTLLISGDRSPGFAMTPAAARLPNGMLVGLGFCLVLPLMLWTRLRRRPSTATS